MRKARFTEEQMAAIIREADRERVSVVAKRHIARSNPVPGGMASLDLLRFAYRRPRACLNRGPKSG
jgi:hypothetical protein